MRFVCSDIPLIGTTVGPSGSVSCDLLVCFHIKETTRQYLDVLPPVSRMHFCIKNLSALVVFTAWRTDQVITIGYQANKISHAVSDVPIEEW